MSKILRKWNYEKQDYEPYEVPEDWKFVLYTDDMDAITVCPHCGKEIPFGDAYTSKEIHTDAGFGYYVCEKCYEQEWDRYKLAQKAHNDRQ